MNHKRIITLFRIIVMLAVVVGLVLGLSRLFVILYSKSRTHTVDTVSPARVAIVFGAGLRSDGTPTAVLRDRVATAAELYFAGKVEKILMSGDNRFIDYNEPGAMRTYALELGIPLEDIVLDYAGRRTYDTCYRAKVIFGVTDAIVVTQNFHLPRTIFTCQQLGLQVSGVSADRGDYSAYPIWTLREIPATLAAIWDVWFSHPLPVLGDPEPIFSTIGAIQETNISQ